MTSAAQDMSSTPKTELNLGYIWLVTLVAALGGLLFGWDWVVIGGAKPFFQRYFQLTSETQIGWANSCALIGCFVGALVAEALSDAFGRKRLLMTVVTGFTVSSVLCGVAPSSRRTWAAVPVASSNANRICSVPMYSWHMRSAC